MKNVLISLLGILMATQAIAGQFESRSSVGPSIDEYYYGTELDIARVVSHSEIPPVCHVVPVEMTYEDSKGNQHSIRYRVMGSGCLNG